MRRPLRVESGWTKVTGLPVPVCTTTNSKKKKVFVNLYGPASETQQNFFETMTRSGAHVSLLLLMLVAPASSLHAPSVPNLFRSMVPVRVQFRGEAVVSLSLSHSPDGSCEGAALL